MVRFDEGMPDQGATRAMSPVEEALSKAQAQPELAMDRDPHRLRPARGLVGGGDARGSMLLEKQHENQAVVGEIHSELLALCDILGLWPGKNETEPGREDVPNPEGIIPMATHLATKTQKRLGDVYALVRHLIQASR